MEPVTAFILGVNPDIVVLAGDFTQHAYPSEFQLARDFIKGLPGHKILVPGNHDMSFYNPYRRITEGLRLYRKYITDDMSPYYEDEEVAILGLNTARASLFRAGWIASSQVRLLHRRMAEAPEDAVRILVTHHPFDLPEAYPTRELIWRKRQMLQRVVQSVDLLLAGHMHISHAGLTATRYRIEGQSAIFVQSGTALSTRLRGSSNAFNVISTEPGRIGIQQIAWDIDSRKFTPFKHSIFTWDGDAWQAQPDAALASS